VKKTEERVKKAFHHEKKRRNVSTTNACNATTPDRACMCGVVWCGVASSKFNSSPAHCFAPAAQNHGMLEVWNK
jgi:hypothetical protein